MDESLESSLPIIRWSEDGFQALTPYAALPRVCVIVATVDGRNRLLNHKIVIEGTEREYDFDAGLVLDEAANLGGYAFLVAITHPWLSAVPTASDLYNARALHRKSIERKMHLLDVIILTVDQFLSLKQEEFA